MTLEKAVQILKIAKAEIEWNYSLEYQEAFDIAIDAIEKQIPKKIKMKDDYTPICPVCGEEVWDMDWCNSCGQRIGDYERVYE